MRNVVVGAIIPAHDLLRKRIRMTKSVQDDD
jgi:hypothetical protein